jgi:hypothetical protein
MRRAIERVGAAWLGGSLGRRQGMSDVMSTGGPSSRTTTANVSPPLAGTSSLQWALCRSALPRPTAETLRAGFTACSNEPHAIMALGVGVAEHL